MEKYYTEERTDYCTVFNFTEKNKKGESLIVWLTKCEDNGTKHSLPRLWHKNGNLDRILPTYWHVETFCTEPNGSCYGRYNPQIVFDKRPTLNFEWMLEATEENKNRIINEIYSMFML